MGIFKKINRTVETGRNVNAKANAFLAPIGGCIFSAIAVGILIMETLDGNLAGGIFGFVIMGAIGAFFFWSRKMNKMFLKKRGVGDKTYSELTREQNEAIKDVFRKDERP